MFNSINVNISFTLYYVMFIAFGLLLGYHYIDETHYIFLRREICNPFSNRSGLICSLLSMIAKMINAATIMSTFEIVTKYGIPWMFIALYFPFSFVTGIALFAIPMKYCKISKFENVFIISAGTFAFIFYCIISLVYILFISASLNAMESYFHDSHLLTNLEFKKAILIMVISFVMLGGLNLPSYVDIISLFFYLSVMFLHAIVNIVRTQAVYETDSDTLIRAELRISCIAYYIESVLVIVIAGSIDPFIMRMSNNIMNSGTVVTATIVYCMGFVMLFILFYFTILEVYISLGIGSDLDTNTTTKTVTSSFFQIFSDSKYVYYTSHSILAAAFVCSHNTLITHCTYIMCTVAPKMIRLPYISVFAHEMLSKAYSLFVIICSHIITIYIPNSITCLYMAAFDILYTIIFPQIIAAFLQRKLYFNQYGALSGLIMAISLRFSLMKLIFCQINDYLTENVDLFYQNGFALPFLGEFIPLRTCIVIISLVTNYCMSKLCSMIVPDFIMVCLENHRSHPYIESSIEDDMESSAATIRINWYRSQIENRPQKMMSFRLHEIPMTERFYRTIPADLSVHTSLERRLRSQSLGRIDRHINLLRKKNSNMTSHSMFKIPLQNRVNMRELSPQQRRRVAYLSRTQRECDHYEAFQ